MFTPTLLTVLGLVHLCIAGYVIEDDYEPSSFFGMFDFFTSTDPTNGYVSYVDQGTAQGAGLINTNNGAVYIGVDHTNVASGSGRESVRITSSKSYNHGLIVLDLAHMPGGACGTWPAFWTVGPNWPNSGEIDIIEGVNQQSQNDMTLHTNSGCSITNTGNYTGAMGTSNCDVNAPGQATNAGCQIASQDSSTYGAGFNAASGGVYATEWTSNMISIWFFPRGSIPSDIGAGNPDPANWGEPQANFQGGCDIDSHFTNQQIVFDTTFCGDWAGNVWSSGSCASQASTCQAFVQNNPSAFTDTYWSINSLKVYQSNGASPQSNIATSSSMSQSTSASQAVSTTSALTTPASSASATQPTSMTSVYVPTSATKPQSSQETVSALNESDFGPAQSAADRAQATASALLDAANGLKNSALGAAAQAEATASALLSGAFPSNGEAQTANARNRKRSHLEKHSWLKHPRRHGGGGLS